MIQSWLDAVLGPWWRTAVDTFGNNFWLFAIPLLIWMWAMFTGGQTQSRVTREATAFIERLGKKADRLSGEELLTRFRPTLREIGERERWMPAIAGLWIQRATPEGIEQAVRLTPHSMAHLQRSVMRKRDRTRQRR